MGQPEGRQACRQRRPHRHRLRNKVRHRRDLVKEAVARVGCRLLHEYHEAILDAVGEVKLSRMKSSAGRGICIRELFAILVPRSRAIVFSADLLMTRVAIMPRSGLCRMADAMGCIPTHRHAAVRHNSFPTMERKVLVG